MRGSHRKLVGLLGRHVVMTRAELAALAGLPPTTISRLVKELTEAGIVRESVVPVPRRPMGRPSRGVSLVGPPGVLLLVAQSHDDLSVACTDFDGVVRPGATADYPCWTGYPAVAAGAASSEGLAPPPTVDAALVVERWLELLDDMLDRFGLPWSGVAAVVVSVPFPLRRSSPGGGRETDVDSFAAALSGKSPVEEVQLLAERAGKPVLAENDANLGALGEAIFGAARAAESVIYLKVVHDIGAGLVIDGRIHRGARGLAGELAHLSLGDGPPCFCGSQGCLCSRVGHLSSRLLGELYGSEMTIGQAATLAAKGDVRAQSCLKELGKFVGRALSGLSAMLDPEAIVVDSELDSAVTYVADGIRHVMERYVPFPGCDRTKVLGGMLGFNACYYGGLALFRDAYVASLCNN